MTIAILGCGWLGQALAEKLIEKKFVVHGSTTTESKLPLLTAKGIRVFQLHVSPDAQMGDWKTFLRAKTLVIALPPKVKHLGEARAIEQFQHFLPLVAESAIEQIVLISSTSIYPENNQIATEDDELLEESAIYKIEQIFRDFAIKHNRKLTILRCGGLMGYDRYPAKYLQPNLPIKNGDVKVNFVHRDDVVAIIHKIITENHWNKIYNIVAPEHPTRRELYIKSSAEKGLPLPAFENATTPIPFKIISVDKLVNETGYTFLFPSPLNFI